MNEKLIEQQIPVVGILHIVAGSLFAVFGIFVFLFLAGIGAAVDDPEAFRILTVAGSSVGALLVVLSIPGILAGYGLLRRRHWARGLAIAVGILNLVNVPIGTAIGVYTLVVLLPTAAEDYFVSITPA